MIEDDLELARLCVEGDERAWERFVREYRPILYRAADALDRTQGAREIAESLYAELYGIRTTGGTQGVGRATTKAVVSASVWIFITTFMITRTFVHV